VLDEARVNYLNDAQDQVDAAAAPPPANHAKGRFPTVGSVS
jgi:hypothetical protein